MSQSAALFPEYRIRQPEGSKKGLHYVDAVNGSIPSVGEQHLCFESFDGALVQDSDAIRRGLSPRPQRHGVG